jgi:AraC-like DNA-binding protein
MSKKRQIAIFDPRRSPDADISSLSYTYANGHTIPQHFHEVDQILFGISGVMAVTTAEGVWIVPQHRAVWIPAKTIHSIEIWGPLTMKTLYLKPRLLNQLGRRPCLLNVSPLLRELLLEVCNLSRLSRKNPTHARLMGVIKDQLERSHLVPLQMPMPSDTRAIRVAKLSLADLSDRRPLKDLCKQCGASKRTIERLFLEKTGMTFGRWRQQSVLVRAIQLLAEGNKVTNVALEIGYNSPSAFIAMFKKLMGTTPAQYLDG